MATVPRESSTELERALISRLKLRHLSLVLAVAQHRNISRVARELGLSQPAVTTALRQVEGIFGVALFERAPGGLVPTSAGQAVIGYAKRSSSEVKATTSVLAAIAAGRVGRIRLGVAHGTSQTLLTTAFTHLIAGDQKVAVVTREGTTDELVRALLDRELDCALARTYDGDAVGVVQYPLYPQEGRLIAATPTAKRLSRTSITLDQLTTFDWIMPPVNTPMRRAYTAMFAAAEIAPPTAIVETVSRRGVAAVLRACPNAIAIVSKEVADELTESGECAALPMRLDLALPSAAFLVASEMHSFPPLSSLLAALKRAGELLTQQSRRSNAASRTTPG